MGYKARLFCKRIETQAVCVRKEWPLKYQITGNALCFDLPLVALQMTTFYESELALRDTISCFRKGHSTSTVLMGMREDFLRPMKTGEVTLIVLADFSEAFNTVNHKILITKLSTLGFSKSFLLSAHFVQIDDRTSESVRFGVPQGSILRPTLFNLYVSVRQGHLPSSIGLFFNTLTILQYTPAVQLLSYKDVHRN